MFFSSASANIFWSQLPSRNCFLELPLLILDFFFRRESPSPLSYPGIDSFWRVQQKGRPLNRDGFPTLASAKGVSAIQHDDAPFQTRISIPVVPLLPPRWEYKMAIHHMNLDRFAGTGE